MAADPVNPTSTVTLREVTVENLRQVLSLTVSEDQQAYVASNAQSIAQAHFHEEAWFRAIYADEVPVGFLMLHDENLRDEIREPNYYFLWRLMIDERYQGMQFGRRALEILVEHVRQRPGADVLLSSFHDGPHSPSGFYEKLGFEFTGKEVDGEVEIRLQL